MQNAKDLDVATAALPLLRSVQDMLTGLPADDSVAASRQIADALAVIVANRTGATAERQQVVSLLDTASAPHTDALLKEYLTTSRHTRQRESELWHAAHQCWQALAVAYAGCVPATSPDAGISTFDLQARVAAARAIRALRWQLQWLRIRYAQAPQQLWELLATLWMRGEVAGLAGPIELYPGVNSTLEREIFNLLALAILTGENLMPPEQDWIMHLVERYGAAFSGSAVPASGCTHLFDLARPGAPTLLGGATPQGGNPRYFGGGAAVEALGGVLADLEGGRMPPEVLALDRSIEAAQLVPVVRQTVHDWAGKPLERRHQREKTNARISVLPGFAQIVDEIDRSMADPFDFTAKAAGESWIASDISPDGFGVVMPAVSGDWVSVGSVLGIEGEAAGAYAVGIVRRIRRLDGGQQLIGVQVMCRQAQAVRVMRAAPGATTRVEQRIPVDRGILLTVDAMRQPQVDLLVSDAALYGNLPLYVVTGDGELLVKLHAVREVNADYALVTLTVLRAGK